jgi:hypothetical protein
MNHIVEDPVFGLHDLFRLKVEDPEKFSQLASTLIRERMEKVGGRVRYINVQRKIPIDSNPSLQARRAAALKDHPKEDPDLRFPMLDLRSGKAERTSNGNRNMLRVFLGIQRLWQQVEIAETNDGAPYDYVLFTRDDALWFYDFSLSRILASGPADFYVLSCDIREPPPLSVEVIDHVVLARRDKAYVYGKYFDMMLAANLSKCAKSVKRVLGPKRGCNSEMILKHILQNSGSTIKKVGQGLFPFQRSVNVKMPNGSVVACMHKVCQSRQDPLSNVGRQSCKDLSMA